MHQVLNIPELRHIKLEKKIKYSSVAAVGKKTENEFRDASVSIRDNVNFGDYPFPMVL